MTDLAATARELERQGDKSGLHAFVERVLAEPCKAQDLLDLGLALRDMNLNVLALRVFDIVVGKWPKWVPGYYEAAFVRRLAGEHVEAARLLVQARKQEPRDARVAMFLIHMLHAVGAHEDARDHYLSAIALAGAEDALRLEEMREFGLYLSTWRRGQVLLLSDRVRAAYGYVQATEIAQQVIRALDTKRPFALIRMGDGEGGCITLGSEDEQRFARLYGRNRAEFTALWFGPDFAAEATGFNRLSRTLLNVALDCDVVGIPYDSWINHEYRISSLRGVPSLNTIMRGLATIAGAPPAMRCCSQLIHVDLHRSGALERIIRHAKRISVISCLPDLPELLKRSFDLEEVTMHRIPGRQGSASVLGAEACSGIHFPDAYLSVIAELERPHGGRLFLVAAGPLGKFYAATIKRFGGVALDIGSVVDGWAGKHTRPGMDGRMALQGAKPPAA